MLNGKKLVVVMPAYNSAKTLEQTYRDIPRDFVDEWLTRDWREAAFWSESANRGSIRNWHTKLHKGYVSGEFIYPAMHCPKTPDLWQVGVDFSDPFPPLVQNRRVPTSLSGGIHHTSSL